MLAQMTGRSLLRGSRFLVFSNLRIKRLIWMGFENPTKYSHSFGGFDMSSPIVTDLWEQSRYR